MLNACRPSAGMPAPPLLSTPTFLLGDTLKVHRHKILLQECLSKQNGRLLLCAINDGTGREGDWVSLIRWKGDSGGIRGEKERVQTLI